MLKQLQPGSNVRTGSIAQKGNASLNALNPVINKEKEWIVDSGASDHMTGNATLVCKIHSCPSGLSVRIAYGSLSTIIDIGTIVVSKNLVLNSVLYISNLKCNLLSVHKLSKDLNCLTKFYPTWCEFQDISSGRMIGNAEERAGLYLRKNEISSSNKVTSSTEIACNVSQNFHALNDVSLWHYRMGHPSFLYMKKLFPSLFNKIHLSFQCETCQLSKHIRATFPKQQHRES